MGITSRHRKWASVLKVFDHWRVKRNVALLKENYGGEPLIDVSLDEMSEEQWDIS